MKWVLRGVVKWVLKDGEMGVEGGERGFKKGSSGC